MHACMQPMHATERMQPSPAMQPRLAQLGLAQRSPQPSQTQYAQPSAVQHSPAHRIASQPNASQRSPDQTSLSQPSPAHPTTPHCTHPQSPHQETLAVTSLRPAGGDGDERVAESFPAPCWTSRRARCSSCSEEIGWAGRRWHRPSGRRSWRDNIAAGCDEGRAWLLY
jgi:hypothetical protein